MISHKHKCIFVHIPKTGGSSIESVLWPGERSEAELWQGLGSRSRNKYQTGGLQHLLARHIRLEAGASVFDSYFKFAFVRNPWDKAVSQFSYLAERPDLRELIGLAADATFAEYLAAIQRVAYIQWQRQVDFLRAEDGKTLVDFVGRFEYLDRDAQAIFGRLGMGKQEIPHVNASRHAHYSDYYNDRTREIVRRLYADDIEAFGYQFENRSPSLARKGPRPHRATAKVAFFEGMVSRVAKGIAFGRLASLIRQQIENHRVRKER